MWFLQPAARQDVTLHSRPLGGSVWAGTRVCVCVCERVGRCAPPGWKCPKISQRQPSHLHNAAFFFFSRFFFLLCHTFTSLFFSPPYLSIVRCSCEQQQQTVTLARSLLSRDSTLPFCAGMQRIPSQRALQQLLCGSDVNCSISLGAGGATTTSFVKCHKTKGGIRRAGLPSANSTLT